MTLFELDRERLSPLQPTTFSAERYLERADLQRLLRDHVSVIADDVLVISEEYGEWADARRRIDLLGVDASGGLVVIELKRDETAGHAELQALR